MAHQNDPITPLSTDIPAFATPLAPYIKNRQETLRIRQVLTFYLRSHISYSDNDPDQLNCHARSHLSLCVPNEVPVDVKRIPSELTGLRKEYLQALQANVAARKQLRTVSEKAASLGSPDSAAEAETFPKNSSLELQAYLKLVRDRRRHAKLQVFEHYLQELRQRDTAKPEDFKNTQQFALPEQFEGEWQSGSGTGGDLRGLLHNLERAVIRAKTQLDKEKKLLEEYKTKNNSVLELSEAGKIPSAVKVAALQRTRDGLVQWVEEKLVSGANNDEEPVQDLPPEEIEESSRILEEQRVRIMEQYLAYTNARKCLLDAASLACQPISLTSSKPPNRTLDTSINATEESPSIEPLEVLSFACDILHPLSKAQRSLALQKFYLSGMLGKEKSTTLRILNRLSDESHLLPEYPILARQPRFKHATAAISSRPPIIHTEHNKPDEIVTLSEAWAFASGAAGSGEKEYVEKKVAEGNERAEEARLVLQKVYDILNQNLEESLQNDHDSKQDTTDIWAYEAQSNRSRARTIRTERRPKGPWTHLNGRVGLAE